MLKNLIIFAVVISASLFAAGCTKAQTNDPAAKIYGDWTGESICKNKEKYPACKDEKVVYHISKSTADASKVRIAADKIVDGKNEPMGEFDFTYDAAKNTLTCEFTFKQNRGIWEFTVSGNSIEGTLKDLPDKTLIREVKVKKSD